MKYILVFACMLLIVIAVVERKAYNRGYKAGYKAGQLDTLPTQSEIQETLGVLVDGVIGPESRRVWDETIDRRECEEFAAPIMEQFMADFDKKYGLDDI